MTQRKFAKKNTLHPGDLIQVDGGFTCIPPHAIRRVKTTPNGYLYIDCNVDKHYLDGQLKAGEYLGIYPCEEGEKK